MVELFAEPSPSDVDTSQSQGMLKPLKEEEYEDGWLKKTFELLLFQVDPLGPLLTLRRLLLSDKALATFRLFITKYWYTVILAAIAVMGLMVTIVKLCGKKTPLLERRRRRRPR